MLSSGYARPSARTVSIWMFWTGTPCPMNTDLQTRYGLSFPRSASCFSLVMTNARSGFLGFCSAERQAFLYAATSSGLEPNASNATSHEPRWYFRVNPLAKEERGTPSRKLRMNISAVPLNAAGATTAITGFFGVKLSESYGPYSSSPRVALWAVFPPPGANSNVGSASRRLFSGVRFGPSAPTGRPTVAARPEARFKAAAAKPVSELAGLGEPPLCARHAEGGLVQAVQDLFGSGPGEGVNDIMHDIPAALQPGGIGWYLPAAGSVLQEQQAFSDRLDDAGEAAGSHWVKARVKLVAAQRECSAPGRERRGGSARLPGG